MPEKETEKTAIICPHCGHSMTSTRDWMKTVNFCGWCGKPIVKATP